MEFKQLQSFAAVAECRSFTRAAERLFVSQPTVSLHIRDLERELKTKLVIRSTHSVELTDSGRALYRTASRILSLRESAVRRLTEDDDELRIGASTIPAAWLLPELLTGFRDQAPQVRVLLDQADSGAVIEGVAKGDFDLGFTGARNADPELVFMPLCRDRLVLITADREPFSSWKKEGGLRREELKAVPFLDREEGSGSRQSAELILEKMDLGRDRRRSAGRVTDPESLKNLVAAGVGVAVVSFRSAEREAAAGRLLTFELSGDGAERDLYLVRRDDGILKTGAAHFIRFVKERYSVK